MKRKSITAKQLHLPDNYMGIGNISQKRFNELPDCHCERLVELIRDYSDNSGAFCSHCTKYNEGTCNFKKPCQFELKEE